MIVKVCGMRNPENIRDVEACGADWMGFIFYPPSPRYVADPPAYLPVKARRVGVFVNATADEMLHRQARFGLDYLQLHGHESPDLCRELRAQGARVIKAFALQSAADVEPTARYADCADYFLFDTPCSTFGGSGRRFDWSCLAAYNGKVPFLLSGGLGPDSLNALTAFRHPQWAGIDLNSGFETAPACKDVTTLRPFIQHFKTVPL